MTIKRLVWILFFGLIFGLILYYPSRPAGVYLAKCNKYIIDSLFVQDNHSYFRKIYQKETRKLLFENEGTWQYKDGRITFTDFFPNNDRKFSENYNFNAIVMTYSYPLEKSYGRAVFDYNEVSGKYSFYKVSWLYP
jgi:hypothetical protein